MYREKMITMGQKELSRWHVLEMAEAGKITLKEAAVSMGVSYRQAKRIRRAVRLSGVKGLIHGNAGRAPANRLSDSVRERVLELSKDLYAAFNDTHFTEKLLSREGIDLSRETVRSLRRQAGIAPKRKRRAPKHRKRRQRMAQEGLMVLWDGSVHQWFGPGQSPCCLISVLDDATGKLLCARFFPFEGTFGYLWSLRKILDDYGIPMAIYQDRHGSLHRNDSHWSIEEQLVGRQLPTQVGVALEALSIRPIFALSPQAKGRIERLFQTLQDRLVAELALAQINSPEPANDFLQQTFIEAFNQKFPVSPQQSQKAWRNVPKGFDLNRIISFHYSSTVANDNTVRLAGITIDIPPGPNRRSYAKAKVEVRQLLDGSWRIYHNDQLIAEHPPTTINESIRALPRRTVRLNHALPNSLIYMSSAPHRVDLPLYTGVP
jgi:transposase